MSAGDHHYGIQNISEMLDWLDQEKQRRRKASVFNATATEVREAMGGSFGYVDFMKPPSREWKPATRGIYEALIASAPKNTIEVYASVFENLFRPTTGTQEWYQEPAPRSGIEEVAW